MSVTSNLNEIMGILDKHLTYPDIKVSLPNFSRPEFATKEDFMRMGKFYQFFLLLLAKEKFNYGGFGLISKHYSDETVKIMFSRFKLKNSEVINRFNYFGSLRTVPDIEKMKFLTNLIFNSYLLAFLDNKIRQGSLVNLENIPVLTDREENQIFIPFLSVIIFNFFDIKTFVTRYLDSGNSNIYFQKAFTKSKYFGGGDCYCVNEGLKAIISTSFSFSKNIDLKPILAKNVTYAILALIDGYEVDKIVINFPNHSQTIEIQLSELHPNFTGFIRKILGFNLLSDKIKSAKNDYFNFIN